MKNIILISVYILSFNVFAVHPAVVTGNEYLKVKDYENAYKSYSSVLVEDAKDKSALYGKSYTLFKMKKYKEALNSFEQLLKIDRNFRDSLYRTAFLYRKVKNYDKAIEYYKEYLKQVKDDPDSYYGLARTHEQKNDTVGATYYFYLYTIKETRSSEDKWVKKAQKKIEKYRAKFTPEQQKQYESLINNSSKDESVTHPTTTVTPSATTVTHPTTTVTPSVTTVTPSTKKVTPKDALNIPKLDKNAKKVETSTDKNLNYIFMKGVKSDDFYLNKKYNDAIIEYRKYLKDPLKRREGLYKMAICNALLKKYSTSVKLLSQIILEEEGNNKVRELLKLLLVNKSVVSSLKDADSSIKNKIGMGKVNELITRGDYYEAIKILDILSANIKNNSGALFYKIDLLRILSKNKEIEENLKSFLSIYPDNVLVNEKYGDFLASQHKKAEALKYYKIAISKTTDKEIKSRLETKTSSK